MYLETLNLTDANLFITTTVGNTYLNAVLTNGSANIANLSAMSNSNIGQYLSPITGFTQGTFVTSVTNSSLVTVSSTYTGPSTSTATVAFYPIVGTSIDTTNYASVVIQATGTFMAEIFIEGSNDNTNWDKLYILPLNDLVLTDNISVAGNYHLKTSTRYIRYNVQQIQNGTIAGIIMYGRSGTGPSAADGLSIALSQEQYTPLNVNIMSGLKTDQKQALVLADASVPFVIQNPSVGSNYIIDTTGYQSIDLTSIGYTASAVQGSNDGLTWSAITGTTLAGVSSTTVAAGTSYVFPCYTKYVRFIASASGTATGFLRQQPYNMGLNISTIAGVAISATTAQLGMNLVNIGGTAAVTGGLAGTIGVGGPSAANITPTYNYLGVGGIDANGFMRRILTDSTGRLQLNGFNAISAQSANTSTTDPKTTIGAITSTTQATAALNVQDTSQFEGQSQVELLALILLELRIANQQRYEMVNILNNGITNGMDPPENFRSDPSTLFFVQ